MNYALPCEPGEPREPGEPGEPREPREPGGCQLASDAPSAAASPASHFDGAPSSPRALRRWRDRRISRRRRADHLLLLHSDVSADDLDCPCDLAATYFSKRGSVSCRCRRRRRGRPRLAGGMCAVGDRDRIYAWRRQARELSRLARRTGGHPDDDEMAALSSPAVVALAGPR